MIKPGRLRPGDTISVVAPARKVDKGQIEAAMQIFESWGLRVVTGDNLFSSSHSYLSGSDEERLSDLQKAINDPDVKAIISARGGYGSGRIIDKLDFSAIKQHPKWVIGFSDITAVHLRLLREGLMSVHGTMPILFSKPESKDSIESLRQLLLDERSSVSFNVTPHNRIGKSTGRLVGGNLSLIVDSMGTATEPDTEGNILVIEEIDEYYYRVDRMLNHLKRAGKLEKLSGLIIGHMTDIKESELPFNESIEQIVLRVVKDYNYPVAFNFPSGHENPNLAWIHGEYYELNVDSSVVHLRQRGYVL